MLAPLTARLAAPLATQAAAGTGSVPAGSDGAAHSRLCCRVAEMASAVASSRRGAGQKGDPLWEGLS
ncbi:hypothetical protein [Immundisolibacter cernigliae]|uniref:Uncharacterized protein n=1 Tax=Immundisolibacter cernigliae TaxID=1810504 RepID=A0A1B1YWF1_9GAMM|nr:hypothetical protein [Immundisolibacter cernigliae]ANX05174.1 hypothetical protein PG2T_13955 [Immundisolibacter cernigliae]